MSRVIKPVSLLEFQVLIYAAAEYHMNKDEPEPIPIMKPYHEDKVESCLNQPFQSVFGKTLYWGFYNKAAALFYFLIKNHPLENGNKRLASLTLLYFALKNHRKVKAPEMELYDLSKWVAMSKSKDQAISKIVTFLKKYTIKYN